MSEYIQCILKSIKTSKKKLLSKPRVQSAFQEVNISEYNTPPNFKTQLRKYKTKKHDCNQ